MKNLINSVRLSGYVGADPEVKTFENGGKMVKVRLATNEPFKNKAGEYEDRTNWHSLVFWTNLAEKAEKICTKGERIAIEGRIQYRDYKDKNGVQRHSTDIEVNEIMHIGEKKKEKLPF